jgi:flagellin
MGISFRTNVESLQAQSELRKATSSLAKSFERLSSGLRINGADDDPAGLQLADILRNQARLADVAVRNANDGLSIASVADNALDAIGQSLSRMLELAQTSANGAYTNVQRSALAAEFVALGSEVERIATTTTFNNIALLSNSSTITLQVGLDGTANSRISVQSVLGTLSSLGLGSSGGALSFSILDISVAGAQNSSQNALSAVQTAIDAVGSRRGVLGAAESRLSIAINYLSQARENFQAAEGRIREIDVAEETAKMVALQVRQQAATAVLAQANLQPDLVLRLLS